MGNTMGSTIWNVKNGELRTLVEVIRMLKGLKYGNNYEMSSEGEMNGDGMIALDVCRLNANGGAIGGDISLKKLLIKCRHTNAPKVINNVNLMIEEGK